MPTSTPLSIPPSILTEHDDNSYKQTWHVIKGLPFREDEDIVDVPVAWLYAGPEGSLASIPPLDRFLSGVRLINSRRKRR